MSKTTYWDQFSTLNEASNAMKAQIRSTYAQMGLSGSSMEAQVLASVDAKVAALGGAGLKGALA